VASLPTSSFLRYLVDSNLRLDSPRFLEDRVLMPRIRGSREDKDRAKVRMIDDE
jgi:hypothetical protein